jgi:hypothetical protein
LFHRVFLENIRWGPEAFSKQLLQTVGWLQHDAIVARRQLESRVFGRKLLAVVKGEEDLPVACL